MGFKYKYALYWDNLPHLLPQCQWFQQGSSGKLREAQGSYGTPHKMGRFTESAVRVFPSGPDLTKSRTDADSDVTPSLGMGTVYVSVASSPTTSMPSTKLRMSALRSGIVPSFRNSRNSATYPLISSVVGSSTLRCSSRVSASSLAASSCSSRCLREKMRGDKNLQGQLARLNGLVELLKPLPHVR